MLNTSTESTQQSASAAAVAENRLSGVSLSQLLPQLRTLLLSCNTSSQIAQELLAFTAKHLSPTILRVDYRDGSQSRVEFLSAPAISPSQARAFSDKWMEPLAVEVHTGPDYAPQLKYFRRENQILTVFAAPLLDPSSGLADGALSVMILGRAPGAEGILHQLDALVTMASMRQAELLTQATPSSVPDSGRTCAASDEKRSAAFEKAAIETVASAGRMAGFSSPKEFAYSLVNSLATQSGAEQVCFGLVENGRIQVLAVSGLPDFKSASPGIALMQQAMEECLDHGALILHQADTAGVAQFAIHRRWSSETGTACLLSIPLSDGDGTVAIVSVRRTANRPFEKEEVAGVLRVLQPCGAGLRILQKASSPLTRQIRSAAKLWLKDALAKNSRGRKMAAICLTLVLSWCLFGTVVYRPLCHARVVSENMVQMTASFEAKLRAIHVQPGEQVRAGQLLAEFDTVDLTLQLKTLDRDIVATEVEVRRAIEARDTAAAALAKARVGVLVTQAASIQQRLESARITAPADGTIIRADIEKRIGQMFIPGELILEFAPNGGWVLEIEVPDDIGTLVRPAQTGYFAAASLTSHSIPFEIKSVDGTTQVMDGTNVFVARAPLGERPEWMKSGMEGTARVSTVPKPVWWVGLHRAIDWCRLSFWI